MRSCILFVFHTVPLQEAAVSGVFCFLRDVLLSVRYFGLLIIRPFTFRLLWSLLTPCSSLLLRFPVCKASSGKRDHLHLIYLPHLRFGIRAVLDFVLCRKLVRSEYAFYAVSVRQTEVLPPTSFRFHLTVDTLVFG